MQSFEIEVALIKAIGRNIDGGPLVNMTDGGKGMSGPMSDQHRESIAIAAAKNQAMFAGLDYREATHVARMSAFEAAQRRIAMNVAKIEALRKETERLRARSNDDILPA